MNRVLWGASLLFTASIAFAACDQGAKDGDKKSADVKKEKDAKSASSGSAAKTAEKAPEKAPEKQGGATDKPATPPSSASASEGDAKNAADAPTTMDITRPNLGTPQKPVMSPTQQTYAMDGIKTIPDACENAHAVLTQAPEAAGLDYDWTYTRQAMLANQQYHVVDGKPATRGDVSFDVHQADDKMQKAWILVANCADGVTCNHLAAMYKAIVKSANPQLFCSDVPQNLGPVKKSVNLLAGGPEANLPGADDARAKCARVAACMIADKTDTKEDIGGTCQKSPQTYKIECARRYPCAEVLSCLK